MTPSPRSAHSSPPSSRASSRPSNCTRLPTRMLFQRSVWAALVEVPFGQTTTYGAIARTLGGPGAAQAVGAANGANPLALVVPIRVIGTDGGLVGYAGGLHRKRFLLDLERGGSRRCSHDPSPPSRVLSACCSRRFWPSAASGCGLAKRAAVSVVYDRAALPAENVRPDLPTGPMETEAPLRPLPAARRLRPGARVADGRLRPRRRLDRGRPRLHLRREPTSTATSGASSPGMASARRS